MAELKAEREMSRAEVAAYLHDFADRLGGEGTDGETDRQQSSEGGFIAASEDEADTSERSESDDTDHDGETTREERDGKVTLTVGNDSATVNPPDTVQFEMMVDSTSGMLESSANETVEFALHWDTEAIDEEDDELSVQ